MSKPETKTLRLILGDQLNAAHSWFGEVREEVEYVLMEVKSESEYVKHHIQKILSFFLAMRAFAEARRKEGHRVRYLKISDPDNAGNFTENLQRILKSGGFTRFEYQMPDEVRLDHLLAEFAESLEIPFEVVDTEHFLTERNDLEAHFEGKKTYLMENFYRMMRKKYDVLIVNGEPAGGKWNYDAENRNRYDGKAPVPPYPEVKRDVSGLREEIEAAGVLYFGEVNEKQFSWPITREEGEEWLEDFAVNRLPWFGKYQDAMHTTEPFLFHSRLSFLMNAKILSPLEIIRRAENEYKNRPEMVDLAQTEGFIRQILGWREYMRGIYWAKMPEFGTMNFFQHDRKLPGYFWTAETKMNCVKHAVRQSLKTGYAHHIQRLMVTGNFALLAGIDPSEVDEWYLGIYVDAIEWVEITNTRGMSQFADGGIVGSKPYVSSANYIDKMSNYCQHCHYSKSKRTGDKSCPFNSFYWDFFARNREKLEKNPRIGMAYRTWERMGPEKQNALRKQAAEYLSNLENL